MRAGRCRRIRAAEFVPENAKFGEDIELLPRYVPFLRAADKLALLNDCDLPTLDLDYGGDVPRLCVSSTAQRA